LAGGAETPRLQDAFYLGVGKHWREKSSLELPSVLSFVKREAGSKELRPFRFIVPRL